MIRGLFPIPVGMYNIGRSLSDKEMSFIKGHETYVNIGNRTSIDKNVLDHGEMSSIKLFIERILKEFFKNVYQPSGKVELKITQSWLNYTEPKQFHHKHEHPNSLVSAVFYPQAEKEKDKIMFFRNNYQQIKIAPKDWNEWNSESWWFEVGAGDLIVFPSSLTHMVPETESKETRISIALNTFPSGHIGDVDQLTSLKVSRVNG